MLLHAGKTIRDIAKFAELEASAITKVARELDLEPATDGQRRAKELYATPQGLTFQEIAKSLSADGFTADDGAAMHHLTVASWVKNYGWAWGGAAATTAWAELSSDKTRVVQLAIIRGAAAHGVTNLAQVKKVLLEQHGDEIRNAKAEPA